MMRLPLLLASLLASSCWGFVPSSPLVRPSFFTEQDSSRDLLAGVSSSTTLQLTHFNNVYEPEYYHNYYNGDYRNYRRVTADNFQDRKNTFYNNGYENKDWRYPNSYYYRGNSFDYQPGPYRRYRVPYQGQFNTPYTPYYGNNGYGRRVPGAYARYGDPYLPMGRRVVPYQSQSYYGNRGSYFGGYGGYYNRRQPVPYQSWNPYFQRYGGQRYNTDYYHRRQAVPYQSWNGGYQAWNPYFQRYGGQRYNTDYYNRRQTVPYQSWNNGYRNWNNASGRFGYDRWNPRGYYMGRPGYGPYESYRNGYGGRVVPDAYTRNDYRFYNGGLSNGDHSYYGTSYSWRPRGLIENGLMRWNGYGRRSSDEPVYGYAGYDYGYDYGRRRVPYQSRNLMWNPQPYGNYYNRGYYGNQRYGGYGGYGGSRVVHNVPSAAGIPLRVR